MKREPLWRRYLRFFGPDVHADVDDELGFHLAMREADEIARGLTPEQARAAARERFGDVERIRWALRRQDTRALRRFERAQLLDDMIQDLRYGFRALRRDRVFAISAVLTLALGIGATTAMFSAVDAAMLRPLPFVEPDRLVTLANVQVPFSMERGEVDPAPNLDSIRLMPTVFAGGEAYAFGGLNLSSDGDPLRVSVGVVTSGLFELLGVRPAIGRGFNPDEGAVGAARVAVLSHGLWRDRFGGAPVVGRTIELSGRMHQIVGVMPAGFVFPERADLWIPLSVPTTFESFEPFRGWLPSVTIARLAPGVRAEAAAARMREMWARVPEERRGYAGGADRVPFVPLQSSLVGDRQKPLLVLLGATTLLLLIGCANVTNLLLVRAAARRREIAMRATLGASRGRLVRQLLAESLLLAGGGAALGIALAYAALGLIRALMPASLGNVAPPSVDVRVLLFAALLALVTGLVFGLWPAWGAARANANETMKSGGHSTSSRGAGRLRRALVVVELAVALTLVTGAGLMLRSFQALLTTDPGFEPDQVGVLEMTFARVAGPAAAGSRLQVIRDALERLGATPGVAAVGVVNDLPLKGGVAISVQPEHAAEGAEPTYARYLQASAGYFQALGIPLLQGRLMTPADDERAPKVVVMNAATARAIWPGESAVGKRIRDFGPPGAPAAFRTVIGVVGDVRDNIEKDPVPQMYMSMYESVPNNVSLVARGALPRAELLAALRRAMREADPRQAVYNVRTMDDVLSASLRPRRTNTGLITLFGAMALVLAVVGVYGVVAYGVAQRTRELGIRAALGATRGDLARLVAREGVGMALAGIVLGLLGAYASAKVLASLLYGVEPTDALTFAAAPVVLAVMAVAATLLPARRASRLNPVDVIRSD